MGKQSYRSYHPDDVLTRFTPYSQKQSDIIQSDAPLTIAAMGTQAGKTIAGAFWFIRQIGLHTDPSDNFLMAAPTYKIMSQGMQPYLLQFAKHLGTYRKSDGVFELTTGGRVYMRTETDPDSVVGIPKVRAYWLDEAGKVGLYFHENLVARAAAVGARGLYTTSPYSRNWIYKNYIKPKQKGLLPEVTLIQAASWESPYHTLHDPEKRKQMEASMDPRRFEMLFKGTFGKQSGLVFDCFDDVANMCEPFRLPNGTKFYGGIDWGHTEPFVIKVRAITPDGQHYSVSEFYKTGMTVPQQAEIAKSKMHTFDIKMFYAGADRPENIMLFNSLGIPTSGVPEKDIQVGTDLHYELIKTRRYKVMEGTSPYTVDEYETYHYPEPEELEDDDDAEEQKPVGQSDHCMQAERYITLRTYRSHLRRAPHTPTEGGMGKPETQEQRLKRLMKPKHRTQIIQ